MKNNALEGKTRGEGPAVDAGGLGGSVKPSAYAHLSDDDLAQAVRDATNLVRNLPPSRSAAMRKAAATYLAVCAEFERRQAQQTQVVEDRRRKNG